MSQSNSLKKIKRALLSVTDKTGLVPFAQTLAELGVELVSTGGTARALREAGLAVRDISDLTGFPEMLDGRVKTLHPVVHGGLLHRRDVPEHVAAVEQHGIPPIDMVVVNLYAFEKTAAKPGVGLEELIENVDIGGPSMLRSAAKNFEDVAVVCRVADYPALTRELTANDGALSHETRWQLARTAFATTAAYDSAIADGEPYQRILGLDELDWNLQVADTTDAELPERLTEASRYAFDARLVRPASSQCRASRPMSVLIAPIPFNVGSTAGS